MALANPEVPMTVEARMGVTFHRNTNAGLEPSGSPIASFRSAAGAVPEAAAAAQPKTASEIHLDGLNEDELHRLQKRIEQKLKLDAARNPRVMASLDESPRP